MQIQQRRLSSSLSKAVCHSHGGCLLQAEYVFKIRREVLEKRLLRRTGISEYRGQSKLPQQVVGCVVDGQRFHPVTHDHSGIVKVEISARYAPLAPSAYAAAPRNKDQLLVHEIFEAEDQKFVT